MEYTARPAGPLADGEGLGSVAVPALRAELGGRERAGHDADAVGILDLSAFHAALRRASASLYTTRAHPNVRASKCC